MIIKQYILAAITLVTSLAVSVECYAIDTDSQVKELIFKAKDSSNNNPGKSLLYIHQALAISKNVNDTSSCYNALGIIHEILGNIDSSIFYYESALDVISDTDDPYFENSIRLNLSQLYFDDGKVMEAFEYAAVAKEKLDSLQIKSAMRVARSKLAYLSLQIAEYEDALDYRKQELNLCIELGDTSGAIDCYIGIASIYQWIHSLDSALVYIERGKRLLDYKVSYTSLSEYYKVLGVYYLNTEQDTQAIENFHKSIAINNMLKISNENIACYTYISTAYLNMQNVDSAWFYAKLSLKIIPALKSHDNLLYLKETYNILVKLNLLEGNYKDAYEYFNEYHKIHNISATNEYKAKFIKVKFESALQKSEDENKLLKQEQEANKSQLLTLRVSGVILIVMVLSLIIIALRANKRNKEKINALNQLKATNGIKDGLLEIISHDLRSPLSSLAGLVNLSTQNLLKPEDTKPLFSMLESTMDKSLSLADNLLIWSKLESNELKLESEPINLKQSITNINKVYSSLADSKNINCIINFKGNNTPIADAFMFSLIIRSILSISINNTLSGGSINITAADVENAVLITVENRKTTLDYTKVNTWKSRAPFGEDIRDKKRSVGLGLFIANEYLTKINSSLIINELEDGISYSFTLPLS